MRAALAIAAAEIRQHRLVLWAGPLLGCLPLVLTYAFEGRPLRPVAPGEPQPNGVFFVVVFAAVLSIAVAVGLGSSAVSRDLEERRLGFWLARPVPLFHYWSAKLGTAFVLAVVAGMLVFLPAHLLGSMSWTATANDLRRGWLAALSLLAFAVAAGNVGGGAVRSKSGLLIVDLVLLPSVWAATWFALGRAWLAGTGQVLALSAVPWLLRGVIVVLLAAGAVQVCAGRLELRRGHALLSSITWGGLLVVFVGGILATTRYVASATPSDLPSFPPLMLFSPRSGSHVAITGRARFADYRPGFLIDTQGRFVRMDGLEDLNGAAWSRDGRTIAWSREAPFRTPEVPTGGEPPFASGPGFDATVHVQRLDPPGLPRRWFSRERVGDGVRAVSPSGARLLMVSPHRQEVIEALDGGTIARVDSEGGWTDAAFLTETHVRALRVRPARNGGTEATVLDWDLAGRPVERGSFPDLQPRKGNYARVVPSDDWQQVLRFDASGLFLHDLDGRRLATLVDGWRGRARILRLSGPRHACIEELEGGLRLRVFGADGRVLSEARIEGRFPPAIGGEVSPGVLALGVASWSDEPYATRFVDLASGRVLRSEPRLAPTANIWGEQEASEPGSLATRLFRADEGLVLLDPATGEKRVLIARGPGIEAR